MVSHSREDIISLESISYHLSGVSQSLSTCSFGKTFKVVRYGVATPKDSIWFQNLADMIQHTLKRNWWNVALIVTPFASSCIWRRRQSTGRSAANRHPTISAHARRVVPIHMEITDKSQFDQIFLRFRFHRLVLLVDEVIA